MVWDIFPHAWASQVHPHMHGFLDPTHYHGKWLQHPVEIPDPILVLCLTWPPSTRWWCGTSFLTPERVRFTPTCMASSTRHTTTVSGSSQCSLLMSRDLRSIFVRAHSRAMFDLTAQYPVMVWDIFPHAGASQVHPHMHGFLDPTHYHGKWLQYTVEIPDPILVLCLTWPPSTRWWCGTSFLTPERVRFTPTCMASLTRHTTMVSGYSQCSLLMSRDLRSIFVRAHSRAMFDLTAQYPVMVWDIFPHAGASQVHPHMHGFLDPTHYHGKWLQPVLSANV